MKPYLISIFVMFFCGCFALRMRMNFYWLLFFVKHQEWFLIGLPEKRL